MKRLCMGIVLMFIVLSAASAFAKGRLVVYCSNEPFACQAVADAFAEKYDVKVQMTRSGSGSTYAKILAEKIRALVEATTFEFEDNIIPVTVSMGLSQMGKKDKESDAFIKTADEKLYEAKEGGRNRVVAVGLWRLERQLCLQISNYLGGD